MLSLWKLRVGAEAYYLSQVASGLDDYYTGHGEAVGRWVGNASSVLGLTGDVTGDDLRAVLAGLAPGSGLTPNGEQLRAHPRRVPGFDLTFSVPKSVSVVYALADPLVQQQVVDAGEAAVAEALFWLEREACHVRRGTNNRAARVADPASWGTRRLPGAGFVAARFGHRTSRAGDPQLHWHVLVANTTRGPDRRWSSLDGTSLYRSQRAAGAIFQSALRRELTQRLGVEWLPTINDAAEIAGVPSRIVRLFSKRRVEIELEMERLGTSGAKAAEAATLATRTTKNHVDIDSLIPGWQSEAELAGWGPADLDRLLTHARTPHVDVHTNIDEIVRAIAGRLVEHDATFTRHDIAQAIAAVMRAGATAAEVDRLTSGVLAHDELLPIGHDDGSIAGWEQRYSTRSFMRVEQEVCDLIASAIATETGLIDRNATASVTHGSTLGDDQLDAVVRICGQGNGVEVLIGRAGTGKTYTLATIADLYREAGCTVIGVAPSARAARELGAGAHIETFTIPRFDHRINNTPLDARSIVIVDEAGMCGTLDLHHVLTTARAAGAKVVLVGDPRQLPEVAAGGGLAAAVHILGPGVCELTVNRRQQHGWEIDALDQLRHGDPTTAWNTYIEHDRVHLADTPAAVHAAAVDDWWTAHSTGADALLLAGTRTEAAHLNRIARRRAALEGHLTGPTLTIADRTFQTGDRVLVTRNDTRQHDLDGQPVRIDNGTLGTIIHVDPDRRSVDVRLSTGLEVRIDNGYLDDGHLDHGYAMTIHKAQGTTCDRAVLVGPAGLYREAAYVALSRARHGTTIHATTTDAQSIATGERDHDTGLPLHLANPTDPEHHLVSALHRTHAKSLALADDPDATLVADLARQPLGTLHHRLAHAIAVETRARLAGHTDPAGATVALEHAIATRLQLTVGGRIRARDRDNIGTVIDIDDRTGTATIEFTNDHGHTTERDLAWHQVHPIDHAVTADLNNTALAWFDRQRDLIAINTRAWSTVLTDAGITPDSSRLLTRAIADRTHAVGRQLHADQPDWLTSWIGPRPTDPAGANVWDDTLTHIAGWRDQHHTPPDTPGIGPAPTDPHLADQWHHAMSELLERRHWLHHHQADLEPETVRPLRADEIVLRLDVLDDVFASAPADQRHLVAELLHARLDDTELHDALVDATRAQDDRARWIVANWPYIVEHQQLTALGQRAISSPAPDQPSPDVLRALEQLAVPDVNIDGVRSRAIGGDSEAETDLAPTLQQVTSRLQQLNDRLAAIDVGLTATVDPTRRQLLEAERSAVRREHATAMEQALAARSALRNPWARRDDGVGVRSPSQDHAVVRDAALSRSAWLIDLLEDLDGRGVLGEMTEEHLRRHVADHAPTAIVLRPREQGAHLSMR